MNINIRLIGIVTVMVVAAGLYAYTRKELKVERKNGNVTYYTDDERYAVTLTDEEIEIIGNVLKQYVWSDQDYNKPIDRGLISRIIGSCNSYREGTCAICSEDAELVRRVLNDFRGRLIQDLYTALGLRREL